MLLRRVIEHVKTQNWTAVGLDFIIVVVGVFVGLQVSNYNDARNDRASETLYLQQLLENFRENRSDLEDVATSGERNVTAMIGLLEQAAMDSPTWTTVQMNEAFQWIHSMPTFTANDSTYANLIGSGDLALIKSSDVKNALSVYYSESELTQVIQNTHELELVGAFQPFILEHLEFQAVARS